MSDNVENDQSENTAQEPAGPVCGERLVEARRARQIAVSEIAKELHLDEPKVLALERNEFDVLGAPVFAKGHLKKYAQLVGVNPDDVLADYFTLERSANAEPVVSVRPRLRQELSPGPWIAVIVVVIIAATAYWWFTRPVEPVVEQSEPVSSPVEEAQESVPPPAEELVVETGVSAPGEMLGEQPEPVVEETSSPPIEDGQVRVLLTYTGDCWTEISDASGRRLFFDLGKDGRTVELSGVEPLNVLFGNPGNVSVLVNGDDYALPADAQPDRPLRLTISGY
jgi:cytoskeleton protein RodZ